MHRIKGLGEISGPCYAQPRHEFDTIASRPRWWARSAQVDFFPFVGVAFFRSRVVRFVYLWVFSFRFAQVREEGGFARRERVYEKSLVLNRMDREGINVDGSVGWGGWMVGD